MDDIDYGNAVAVVTGGGDGIGKSIVQALAARGASVVVTDIRSEAAEAVASQARSSGVGAIAVTADVAKPDDVERLANVAYEHFGKVDILVNNAGVTIRPFRSVSDGSIADFQFMMNVNYFGVVNGLRSFLPRMRQQEGRRHIVNTSSMATLHSHPGHSMYTAAKAAVDGLSDVLREELIDFGENIGVTVLFPGNVTTGIGATSEGLRPDEERGATRAVTAYPTIRPFDMPHHQPLSPELVGDMVLRAIDANAPYCVTHPAPVESLRQKVEAIAAGYFPAP